MRRLKALLSLMAVLFVWVPLHAQDLAPFEQAFEKRVTVKKLENGLTVILIRRPKATGTAFTTVGEVLDYLLAMK